MKDAAEVLMEQDGLELRRIRLAPDLSPFEIVRSGELIHVSISVLAPAEYRVEIKSSKIG